MIFDESCDQVNIDDYKLSCLMYEDDIVLMSSSAEGLQVAINKLQLYLSEWHLELNTSKSKIIIFNKSGLKLKQYKFFFNNQDRTTDNFSRNWVFHSPKCNEFGEMGFFV